MVERILDLNSLWNDEKGFLWSGIIYFICHPDEIGPQMSINGVRPLSSCMKDHCSGLILKYLNSPFGNRILEMYVNAAERDCLSLIEDLCLESSLSKSAIVFVVMFNCHPTLSSIAFKSHFGFQGFFCVCWLLQVDIWERTVIINEDCCCPLSFDGYPHFYLSNKSWSCGFKSVYTNTPTRRLSLSELCNWCIFRRFSPPGLPRCFAIAACRVFGQFSW